MHPDHEVLVLRVHPLRALAVGATLELAVNIRKEI